jgi:putative transposase
LQKIFEIDRLAPTGYRKCEALTAGLPIMVASTVEAFMEDSSTEDSTMVSMGDVASEADTWTQQLAFHPHVHCLVSGGGISKDLRDTTADCTYGAKPSVTNRQPEFSACRFPAGW